MVDSNTSTQALASGTRIGDFVIQRVLGSGGFGMTYLARDVRLNRQVVIKENLPAQYCFRDPGSLTVSPRHAHQDDLANFQWSLDNFSKEAAMLASLDHPGIVKVLGSFEAFGTACFVMPYMEGDPLDELARRRADDPFSEDELTGLLEWLLDALAYLHERGIFHRDIKPSNILVTRKGVPVLIDFGSARQQLGERSMTVVESAGYSPFEQLQSRGNVGPWSDLYALAATVVKLMTGEAPPKANDRTMGDPWQPLAGRVELRERFSEKFLACMDRALKLPIEERWQNAEEWKNALSGCDLLVSDKTASGTTAPSDMVPKRKSKWPLAAAAAALAWAAIGGWWALRGGSNATPEVMQPIPPATGGLVITSEPSSAVVKNATGEPLGNTPLQVKGLPGGHKWEGSLELEGYNSARVVEEVTAGDVRLVPLVKLQPAPQKVVVTSEPNGAEVLEAGSVIGKTPFERTAMPGTEVAYQFKLEGYEESRVGGTVKVGEPLALAATLKLLPKQDFGESEPGEDKDKSTVVTENSALSERSLYPWKTRITASVFWIGGVPSASNPAPIHKSSWDGNWSGNFGGYDNPDPETRIADHATGEFRPKSFIPKLNPFYIALPYNDLINHTAHKPEASRVIPWFARMRPEPGKTVCKGRWVQIYRNGRSCFAQWEDSGPQLTDDWEYVFGNKPPKNSLHNQAGICISPAVRDYFGLKSGQKVHWRFVEAGQVPYGPWKNMAKAGLRW